MRNAQEAGFWSGSVPAPYGGDHLQIRALHVGGHLRSPFPQLLCKGWLHRLQTILPACATAVRSTLQRPRVGRA